MPLLKELMSDWVGLLSLITILAVLAMAGYYAWLFSRKVSEESAARQGRATGGRATAGRVTAGHDASPAARRRHGQA
ncbi:MAG: DUF3149 domain-containing protein [Rhodocyclaceae bacterium]|nr:DUF3149 domain-containing protein [Rhodocyclaceae bacterium]